MTDRTKPRASPTLVWIAGASLFLALVLVAQLTVGWNRILESWSAIPPATLAGSLLLVLGSYGIRTMRVHRYFLPTTRGHFHRSFRLVLLHNLFNNFLPMRTGEASFPFLMKREFQIPFGRSVPALLF
ncbi:lysylphosphatidylglycerol synthase domain-containing protein, partial [Gemmatimonadota bacterium]